MTNNSDSNAVCPKCGAPIPPEAPQGLCPKCVMSVVATEGDGGLPLVGTGDIPTLERVGRAFPNLEVIELIGRGGMGFVFQALQYAHDQGILYRDIKPENILIDNKGRVKIADFGIAKIIDQNDDYSLTGTRHALGTPNYMAPEQRDAPTKVDHRADIYALGVVFYEMLTGELPMGRFELPSKKLNVDIRIDEVVLKSLERNPELRYQTVGAVKTDVDNIAGDKPRRAFPRTQEVTNRS